MVKELEAFMKEMQGWTPELPDMTFDNEMIIHDRAHEMHLVFKGRAHTGGDICVFSRKEGDCDRRRAEQLHPGQCMMAIRSNGRRPCSGSAN